MEKFVCAFRGRRDSYQVPLALAEAGLLEEFITDAYSMPWMSALFHALPVRLREKMTSRAEAGIPLGHVRCLWGSAFFEHLLHRGGYSGMIDNARLDRRYSEAAGQRAAETRSHLFLYSPYAYEAFIRHYSHDPLRVMLQYHPHPDVERRILEDDARRHPGLIEAFGAAGGTVLPQSLAVRERDCARHADVILCASSFTRRSLEEAGVETGACHVVPYGITLPEVEELPQPSEEFSVLFVGSGGQRKGLHHLLLAWARASLPASSRLTLVCRVIDRGIEKLAANTPGVEVVRGANSRRLSRLYAEHSLFAMPSLVEGFGQVYLEALAHGCPVLGTANTALPDLGTEASGVFLTPPGDVDALVARLEELAARVTGNRELRAAGRLTAGRFTWSKFREGVRQHLQKPPATVQNAPGGVTPGGRDDGVPCLPLSAIITAFQRHKRTKETVRRLQACRPAFAEILVHVDGGNQAFATQLRQEFPTLRVLESAGRVGPGGARNLLIKAARENLVASFDDDSYPQDMDYCQRVVDAAAAWPVAAVFAATVDDGTPAVAGKASPRGQVSGFVGCGCVYRRKLFLKTRGYVPLPLAYGMEEMDVALQMHALGLSIVAVPELRVVHEVDSLYRTRNLILGNDGMQIVDQFEPGHRNTPEISAAMVSNLALLAFLRYPLMLWPVGLAQCLRKALQLVINGRWKGAVQGLWRIPSHLWRYRSFRSPLGAADIISHLRMRRGVGQAAEIPVAFPEKTL